MTEGAEPAMRPLPWPDPISQGYWDGARKHELHIQRCADCRRWIHLPTVRCAACGSLDLGYERASGKATLHSWTVVHEAPAPGFRGMLPLILGVAELVEQPKLLLSCNIVRTEASALKIGMALAATFDKAGPDTVLIQFTPAEG